MNTFKKNQNVTTSTDINFLVKEKINIWAKSFQNQNMKDFVNDMKITEIFYSPLDIIVVNTMFESREISNSSIPYNSNKTTPNVNFSENQNPQVINLWNLTLDAPPSTYQNQTFSHSKPEYSYIENCSACNALGNFECKTCNGKGKCTCSSCSGTGYTTCTSCSGTGSKNCIYCYGSGAMDKVNQTTQNYERVPCTYCLGLRTTRCTSCTYGKNNCSSCAGSRILRCESCSGKGNLVCISCEGNGKVLWNTSIIQHFISIKNNMFYIFPQVKVHFKDFLPDSNLTNKVMQMVYEYENMGEILIPHNISTFPNYYLSNTEYTNMLTKFTEEESLKSNFANLTKQKIQFYQSDTYLVKYQYASNEYILLVDLYSNQIYAPESPFSAMAKDLIWRVKKKIGTKKYADAMQIAKQALFLGKGSTCEMEIEALIETLNSKIFDDYKKGVTFGILISWITFILINLVKYLEDDSINYLNYILPSIICIVLYMVMKFLEQQIRTFASKIAPQYIINNNIARILLGCGLSSGFVCIFVYAIVSAFG